MNQKVEEKIPTIQKYVAVLWPSFIMSGIATILFFAALDPVEVLECNGYPSASRIGAYTLGFFLFWILTGASCLLSVYFGRPCSTVRPKRK